MNHVFSLLFDAPLPNARRAAASGEPQIETIEVLTRNDVVCACDVVWMRVDRQWHVAFLNRIGATQHPTGNIEDLATAAYRFLRLRPAALTVWDVDRRTTGVVTSHRVEFAEVRSRRASGPRWRDDVPPAALWSSIDQAFRRQLTEAGASNAPR